MLLFALALVAAPQQPFADLPQQDALSYAIALTVDVEQQTLQGSVDYVFAAVEPLATITLDARRSPEWRVDFTDADGKAMFAAWRDEQVVLTLSKPLAKGEQVRFHAALAGKPVDGFYFTRNRHGAAMAFTDHYAIRARGWLPCEDHPADRAKFSLHVVHAQGLQLLGYGTPVAHPVASWPAPPAGFVAADLAADAEIPPYMLALVLGPYARVHEDGDARLVDHFVYARDVEKAKAAYGQHATWLQTMERTFGPYLFGKYTTAQCPTRWGGFEAPGNVLLAEDLFEGADHGRGTLAHELVHMWFGDGVGYAAWRDVWLSEGFASYFGPWLQSQTGGPSHRDSLVQMRESWRRSREGRIKSIRDDHFATPDLVLNANTYPKGAWVLHMLRGELGDEAFFKALRAYYGQFAGQAVRNVDFTTAVEKSSGAELSGFFTQWLDRVGCPELKVVAADGAIAIEQVQPGEPYVFWLRLRWRDAAGAVQQQRVRVSGKTTNVPATGGVQDLEVDPDVELLFRPARS